MRPDGTDPRPATIDPGISTPVSASGRWGAHPGDYDPPSFLPARLRGWGRGRVPGWSRLLTRTIWRRQSRRYGEETTRQLRAVSRLRAVSGRAGLAVAWRLPIPRANRRLLAITQRRGHAGRAGLGRLRREAKSGQGAGSADAGREARRIESGNAPRVPCAERSGSLVPCPEVLAEPGNHHLGALQPARLTPQPAAQVVDGD